MSDISPPDPAKPDQAGWGQRPAESPEGQLARPQAIDRSRFSNFYAAALFHRRRGVEGQIRAEAERRKVEGFLWRNPDNPPATAIASPTPGPAQREAAAPEFAKSVVLPLNPHDRLRLIRWQANGLND